MGHLESKIYSRSSNEHRDIFWCSLQARNQFRLLENLSFKNVRWAFVKLKMASRYTPSMNNVNSGKSEDNIRRSTAKLVYLVSMFEEKTKQDKRKAFKEIKKHKKTQKRFELEFENNFGRKRKNSKYEKWAYAARIETLISKIFERKLFTAFQEITYRASLGHQSRRTQRAISPSFLRNASPATRLKYQRNASGTRLVDRGNLGPAAIKLLEYANSRSLNTSKFGLESRNSTRNVNNHHSESYNFIREENSYYDYRTETNGTTSYKVTRASSRLLFGILNAIFKSKKQRIFTEIKEVFFFLIE